MTAGRDLAFFQGSQNGAALLAGMRAGGELTLTEILLKLREAILQLFLVDHLVTLQIDRGKTGGVGDKAAVQLKQFHNARGVSASAELFADIAGLQLQLRKQAVKQRGLADAAVAGKGADLAAKEGKQGVRLFPAVGRTLIDADAAAAVILSITV